MQQNRKVNKRSSAAMSLAGLLLLGGTAWAQTGASTTMPDAQIEANVLKALAGAPQLTNENITSNTVYGTVTLTGTVKDESTRSLAENTASRAPGVKKVVDELALGSGQAQTQSTNPSLQSDGTMAPPSGQPQHAPDPDVYAAQQAVNPDQNPQSQGNANQGYGQGAQANQPPQPGQPQQPGQPNQPPQPGYRQPYAGPYGNPQAGAGYPQNYPQNGPQAGPQYGPPNGQQPYTQGYSQGQPVPYGAQVAGKPVTVPPGALLRVRINEGLDSKHTQPGTPFDAVVLNDVVADGTVAIPRGAAVQGTVTEAKSGGVIRGHGELILQLNQVTLGGRTYPITSDVWQRDSSDKGLQTVNNAVGLGAAGAIIGAIAGGGAGAAIGAGAGGLAGVGTSAASGSRQVLIPSEAILTFHLAQPAALTTISQAEMDRLSYGVPTGAQQPRMGRRYPQPAPGYYGPVYYPRPYPY